MRRRNNSLGHLPTLYWIIIEEIPWGIMLHSKVEWTMTLIETDAEDEGLFCQPIRQCEACVQSFWGESHVWFLYCVAGCFSKDQVYLEGILNILRYREQIDFPMLMALGKVSSPRSISERKEVHLHLWFRLLKTAGSVAWATMMDERTWSLLIMKHWSIC